MENEKKLIILADDNPAMILLEEIEKKRTFYSYLIVICEVCERTGCLKSYCIILLFMIFLTNKFILLKVVNEVLRT